MYSPGKYFSPPKAFEQKYGLKGFSENYQFPDNLTAEKFERRIGSRFAPLFDEMHAVLKAIDRGFRVDASQEGNFRKGLGEVRALNDELVQLNPQLLSLKRNLSNPPAGDINGLADALFREQDFHCGVISGMLPRDIDYYLNVHVRLSIHEKRVHQLADVIVARKIDPVLLGVEWVTSPETTRLLESSAKELTARRSKGSLAKVGRGFRQIVGDALFKVYVWHLNA